MQQSWDFKIKVVGTHSRLSGHRPSVFQGREGGGLARLVESEEMFMVNITVTRCSWARERVAGENDSLEEGVQDEVMNLQVSFCVPNSCFRISEFESKKNIQIEIVSP